MASDTMSASKSDAYGSSLRPHNVEPLWTVMGAMVPPKPNPKAAVASWKYDVVRPLLLEAGRLVNAEEAERRVLMLVNPAMKAPHTTDTIYAGLQLILPGETAPAHRHVAFALRFIIEGDRGFTAVGGRKMVMERGDVILTPVWNWHDHGHEGNGPMIWLDGLDLPLYQALPTNFAEPYSESRYPSKLATDVDDMKVPWAQVQKHLDAQEKPHAVYEYEIVRGGKRAPLSTTIGAQAERIEARCESPPVRETCSFVYHCFDGSGSTTLKLANGNVEVVEWSRGDTFAVPAWTERVHTAQGATSYLFAVTDAPLIRNLGMYRREGL